MRKTLVCFALILLACATWPATITRYVNAGSTAGGDGTTNATEGANRAYATLTAAIAATGQDLTDAGGDILIIEVTGPLTEPSQVDTTGYTTGAAGYVVIRGYGGVRASITISSGDWVLINRENYTQLYDLYMYGGAEGCLYPDVGGATNVLVHDCIFGPSSGNYNVSTQATGGSTTFWNCISYDSETGFIVQTASTFILYNCTSVDNSNVGYRCINGTMTLVNCIGYNNTNFDFLESSGTMTTSYCLSEDATADDNGATGAVTGASLTFRNYAGNDFALAATDTDAIGAGDDDPGTGLFSDDFEGNARSSPWDIGASEYVAAGTVVPQIMYNRMQQ